MNLKKLSWWVLGLPWLMFATGFPSGSGNVIDDGLASTSQAVSVDERDPKPGLPASVAALDTGSSDLSSLTYRRPNALTLFDFNRWSPGFAHIQQQFLGSSTIFQTGTYMSVHSPAVPITQRANHSLAQMWVMSGSRYAQDNCRTDCIQSLEAGWIVDPEDYGDGNPHFFIYATNNGYGQSPLCRDYVGGPDSQYGCLEFDLAAYPPVSPGDVLASSVPGGTQEELQISIANDSHCYGWSVYVNNWLVGMWPASQFTGTMQCSAENSVVGGEVYASPGQDSYTAVHMGSGAPPLAGYGRAAFFHDFYACTPDGGCPNYQFQVVRWTDRLLYGMSTTPPPKPAGGWVNYFYYGDLPLLGWFVGGPLLL